MSIMKIVTSRHTLGLNLYFTVEMVANKLLGKANIKCYVLPNGAEKPITICQLNILLLLLFLLGPIFTVDYVL